MLFSIIKIDKTFNIGDYVLLKKDRKGIVRYIGKTAIVRGTLVGVELDKPNPAGSNGTFCGETYFECENDHGVFVKVSDVMSVIKTKQVIFTPNQNYSRHTKPDLFAAN